MGELSLDNIWGEQEIETLFTDPEIPSKEEEKETSDEAVEKKEEKATEAVDPESLFDGEQPESVGSGKDIEEKGKEDAIPDEDGGTSPNDFYSSIASALAVDGVFPNLDEKTVKSADTAEAFSELFEAEVNARLDERQRRVAKALENGVDTDSIKKYENTLHWISTITDSVLSEESDDGEQLRKNIIYQDFLNKGYSKEKARKFTERAIDAGTDIEDAREALQSNKEFFQTAYDNILKEAQQKADAEKEALRQQSEKLKESIMKDKYLFGDIELNNEMRKKVFENISKPVYRDPKTGEYLTAIQKFDRENRGESLKYLGLIYTLTNGFKDFDSFTKSKVKKEMRKGLRELEHTINATSRNSDGSLRMVTGVRDDPESFISKGVRLDI